MKQELHDDGQIFFAGLRRLHAPGARRHSAARAPRKKRLTAHGERDLRRRDRRLRRERRLGRDAAHARPGLNVAVLEAGRKLDPATDFTEHKLAHDMPLRGSETAAEGGARGAADPEALLPVRRVRAPPVREGHGAPLHDAEAGKPFTWIRGRHVGGKSIMWARQSYRLSDLRPEGRVPRRLRQRLADRLRRAGALLRPRRVVHRRVGPGRGPAAASRTAASCRRWR